MKVTLTLLVATAITANAAITMTKDATAFDYIYDQSVLSSSQDLDSNTTVDFYAGNPGELPSISGGIASFTSGDFYRGDYGGSLSRANFFTTSDPFTIEIDAKMLSTAEASGSLGTMAIFWRSNTDPSSIMYIDDSQVSVNNGGTVQVLSTSDNTDAFHAFRLAFDGTTFSAWRDGSLLGENLALPNIGGADGLFVGDTGSSNSGDWELDTMSITTGAFAPVPEPTTTTLLLGLGALGLVLRRRRK